MAGKQKTGLQWILPEASKLRRQYPKRFDTWQEYVEQATAIYHKKNGDTMPKRKSSAKTKKSAAKRRPAAKRGSSRSVGKTTHAPAVGIAYHIRHACLLLERKIGDLEASKLRVKTKTARKKIQKKITAAKAEYRRLK